MAIDRIHDRVPKVDKSGDYWEVAQTQESKEEKKRDEDKGRRQREQDAFGESSDFTQLLAKDPRQYRRQELDTSQISKFTFRGISTHREKAVVEVDIALSDGTLIRGAQVAISRQEGLKFISRKPGDQIVVDQLVKGASQLNVAIPKKPEARSQIPASPQNLPADLDEEKPHLGWFYYLMLGVLILAVVALIYIFFST